MIGLIKGEKHKREDAYDTRDIWGEVVSCRDPLFLIQNSGTFSNFASSQVNPYGPERNYQVHKAIKY